MPVGPFTRPGSSRSVYAVPAMSRCAQGNPSTNSRRNQPAEMPGRANSTIWNFAVCPADPDLIYANSVSGEVYRSTDAGASWVKLQREFGEIRALAWTE